MIPGRFKLATLVAVWVVPAAAMAEAREVAPFEWEGVERIVAIGDVHGDHDQFRRILEAAGIVDDRGRWDAGATHLVQTGDVVDRGPDSRDILDTLDKLASQAEKAGGRVHRLIGNHEAMNVYGDLRYVHPGEYEAFANRESDRLRDQYYDAWMRELRENDPAAAGTIQLTEGHREQWMSEHPRGWVEHRFAWHTTGEYGERVLESPAAVRINDTLFLHGGLSAEYCADSPAELTDQVHNALETFNADDPGILVDENGPLWFRGLADGGEAAMAAAVDGIFECAGVERIVVGHTPTPGIVWPRFDGRVVVIDTGIAAHYGGHAAWLEIDGGDVYAGYPEGRVPLPTNDAARLTYLESRLAAAPGNERLAAFHQRLTAPPEPPTVDSEVPAADEESPD